MNNYRNLNHSSEFDQSHDDEKHYQNPGAKKKKMRMKTEELLGHWSNSKAYCVNQREIDALAGKYVSKIESGGEGGHLRKIIKMHLNGHYSKTPHPTVINIKDFIERAEGEKPLPADTMTFYEVERHGSYSLYLGVYGGKIYRYSSDIDLFFQDEEGNKYQPHEIEHEYLEGNDDLEEDNEKIIFLVKGTRIQVQECCKTVRRLSGPYDTLSRFN